MRVLVLNPPFHPNFSRSQRSPAVIKSGVVYYPIWLAYATGVLEDSGFETKLVDAPAAGFSLQQVLDLSVEFNPRLIVMDTSTPSIVNDVEVAEAIKSQLPGVFILLVGTHVTVLPAQVLEMTSAIGAVARGEYDYTVRDLAWTLENGGGLEAVQGLSYRLPDGRIVHNDDRALIKDLDALPFVSRVYRDHLRVEDYFYSITRYPEVAIISARGCPHKCSYCLWPQVLTGHQYRRRSPANVAEEFEFIVRELPQVKEVFIEDDTLTVNPKYASALAGELIGRENHLPFSANSRPDVEYPVLQQLKQAGLRLLCVGFESGDQAILDSMRKGIQVEQFSIFRQAARRAGVLVHGCFMAGNPGETRDSLEKTLSVAKQLNPDTAQFFPLMVYPGTEVYAWAEHNEYLITDDYQEWLTSDGLHRSTVNLPGLSAEELVAWCDEARRSFYLRLGYILTKVWQVLIHPSEAPRMFKAARTFTRYLFRKAALPSETRVALP